MSNNQVQKMTNSVVNKGKDVVDKCVSPSMRAGFTAERVARMRSKGVAEKVIVTQLNENAKDGQTYDEAEIGTLCKLYDNSTRKVGVTSKVARALIDDQEVVNCGESCPEEVPA